MKKTLPIYGVLLVSLLMSCGGIKSDAKKVAELTCKHNRLKKQSRLSPSDKLRDEMIVIEEEMNLLMKELAKKPELLDHKNEFEAECKKIISETADCSCELSAAEKAELEKQAIRAQDSIANLIMSSE